MTAASAVEVAQADRDAAGRWLMDTLVRAFALHRTENPEMVALREALKNLLDHMEPPRTVRATKAWLAASAALKATSK